MNLSSLIISTLLLTIPLGLAAIGATINEKSGVINIGIEGMMLMGSFTSVLGAYYSGGNMLIGMLCGILGGMALGLIHAVITIEFGGSQPVSSLGISLFASGVTTFLLEAIFKTRGNSPKVNTVKTSEIFSDIPVIGKFLSQMSPYFYILIVVAIAAYYVLYHTPVGLRLVSVGEDPKTAESVGINVWRIRYCAMLISSALAGLGGSYLSIGNLDRFQENMVAGRGYIALAAMILGRWNIKRAVAASLLFAFFEALKVQIQITKIIDIPVDLLSMLPYIITLIMLSISVSESRGPKSNGISFLKHKYQL